MTPHDGVTPDGAGTRVDGPASRPAERTELPVTGEFSLRAAAEFGFGPDEGRPPPFDGSMRLAFPIDGGRGYAGAVVRQAELHGSVSVELTLEDGGDGQLGRTFELEGRALQAFPQPQRLLELTGGFPGLDPEKHARLRGVAEAALAGRLDVRALQAIGPERAYEEVQRLKGLGPFDAGLIVLRASGFADAMLPVAEPKVLTRAAAFYGRSEPPSLERFIMLAERWRPFRTWATVLIRLAGDRGTPPPNA
jgi:hypothetical protein